MAFVRRLLIIELPHTPNPSSFYGFCHNYSSFYVAFATITLQLLYMGFASITSYFIWLLPESLLILHGFCHSYSSFYMVCVRRLLIIKLPHPRLVQPPFPCMRAEIGEQIAKTERFGQEVRQELRAESSKKGAGRGHGHRPLHRRRRGGQLARWLARSALPVGRRQLPSEAVSQRPEQRHSRSAVSVTLWP